MVHDLHQEIILDHKQASAELPLDGGRHAPGRWLQSSLRREAETLGGARRQRLPFRACPLMLGEASVMIAITFNQGRRQHVE